MKAGKVEPTLKSFKEGKVAQQCIHEYFNLFTNIYTLYLNHTQTKYRRLIFTLKWNYLFGSFLGSHNIMTILSQGSLLVLIIRSAMGLLDQSKFLATYRPALFSKWHFYGFVCDIISCIKIWCLQQCAAWQVNFLSNATKCIAHRNWVRMVVLVWRRTESSCWVIGGGAEDSRSSVITITNMKVKVNERNSV